MNNLDPASRQRLISLLAIKNPASVYRLSATSRSLKNNTAEKRRQLNALKSVVRRKAAYVRHFKSVTPGGQKRLSSPLFEARRGATVIAKSLPVVRKASHRARRVFAARKAYADYQHGRGTWNRFVRINAKIGLGNSPMTKEKARKMYPS